ncbi:putative membrane protein [Kutzneria buriramensis]|uniref:Putative membrane protein n=2 Tax=Kutzneria buriramensis TaxID=1045776 RepID=A0A3E0H7G4_9PSEU|nr:putative membrane protein [Kutzneria buriramensis]
MRTGPRGSDVPAGIRTLASVVLGAIVGVVCTVFAGWRYGLLVGWLAGAGTFVLWLWVIIWPMSAERTKSHAVREDPGRAVANVVVLAAAVASLVAVGALLSAGGGGAGAETVQALVSIGAVGVAWAAVHTVFTTRYARLYYSDTAGGVDFNEDEPPSYGDFAYLAFTIGMTFQVSDTDLTTREIRRTALRHALLSYLFGAVIIATVINLVAGLGK